MLQALFTGGFMGGTKIYLAGSSCDEEFLPLIRQHLRRERVLFTTPWWDNVETGRVARELGPGFGLNEMAFNGACAADDLRGIQEADVVVFALRPDKPTPVGMFELSAAVLSFQKPVLIISSAAPNDFDDWIFLQWCILQKRVHWWWGSIASETVRQALANRLEHPVIPNQAGRDQDAAWGHLEHLMEAPSSNLGAACREELYEIKEAWAKWKASLCES